MLRSRRHPAGDRVSARARGGKTLRASQSGTAHPGRTIGTRRQRHADTPTHDSQGADLMAPRDSISKAIRTAKEKNGAALIAYITAGFPTKEAFRDLLASVGREADVIEVGV